MKINIKINRIANIILAEGDYQYIHDPEHRNKPHGAFFETEKGWSNDPKDNNMKEGFAYGAPYRPNSPNHVEDYSTYKYKPVELTDEQRAEYPPITLQRSSELIPIRSTFIGASDSLVSPSEAHQINKASNLFLQYAQNNESKHDEGQEVATYVDDEIPRAIKKGTSKKPSYSFHPSEDIIHNIKFFEFLDKVNPKLTQKLLDSSYLAPHEQTPKSLELADSIHQIDNGDLGYKPRFG